MFYWIMNGDKKNYTVRPAGIMKGWLDPKEHLWVCTLIQGDMMQKAGFFEHIQDTLLGKLDELHKNERYKPGIYRERSYKNEKEYLIYFIYSRGNCLFSLWKEAASVGTSAAERFWVCCLGACQRVQFDHTGSLSPQMVDERAYL